MSDQIVINVVTDPPTNITISDTGENIYLNPLTLNQGIINHSVTHQSGGSDVLFHNLLGGLSGGSSGAYFHLSSAQYQNLVTGSVIRPSDTGVFYPRSNPSGYITGVDLSAYVTGVVVRPSETGVFITQSQTGEFYSTSNPSGFITGVNLSSYATTNYVTGVSGFLQTQITTLNSQTGSYVTGNVVRPSETGNFITTSQTGAFYAASNPSGFITGVDLSFSGNYYTKSESESRYVNTTGTETILGDKTFHDRVYINNLYVTGLETIVNTTNTNVASNYIMLNLTGGAVDGGLFFVTGSGLTGINDSGAILGFDHSDKFKFGIGTRASDLSVLDTIASVEEMTGISGSLQTQISSLSNATGSYVLNSQTGVFYPTSNPSGFITGVDLSPYATITNLAATGSTLQTNINNLSGVYATISNLNSTGSSLDSKINLLSGSSVLLYGNQTISGIKSFTTGVNISGNLTVDTNTLFVDSVNNRVGVGTASPNSPLHVIGSLRVDNGSTAGALNFGADVQATTRSSNVRKLAAIVSPDFANIRTIEWASSDSDNSSRNLVYLGGRVGGSNFAATEVIIATAPTISTNGGTTAIYVDSSQRVGIGTTSLSERLTVSGNISASGTIIASNYNPAANVATFLATPTSANLAAAVTDETGTGSLVFGTSPTISNPTFTNFFTSSLTDSIATCVRDGPIPKFRLFEDFGNAGVGIIAGAGNNGFNFTSTAGRGSNAVYTQPFGNRGVSVLAHGINSITTGGTLADTANYFLPLGGGGMVGCSGQYCFALASVTNVIVSMSVGINANVVSFEINSALGQLNVIQGGTVGSSTTTLLSGISLSTGNFSSGTRYRFYYKIVSTTEVDVYLASAPFNSTTWTTIYSGIATIPAMTLTATENLVFPYFGLRTNETATKTMYIDWIAVEKDVTR